MKPQPTLCPECNGPMVSRQNKQTKQYFWGCADFPRCRGTRNTDGEAPEEVLREDAVLPSERQHRNDRRRW